MCIFTAKYEWSGGFALSGMALRNLNKTCLGMHECMSNLLGWGREARALTTCYLLRHPVCQILASIGTALCCFRARAEHKLDSLHNHRVR